MMGWLLDQAVERGEPVADPVGVRGRDLPALRLRDRHAPDHVRHRADARPVRAAGRAARADAAGRPRRGVPAHPAGLRRGPTGRSRARSAAARRKWRHELLDDAEWMRRGNGSKFIAVLEVDGAVRGYAIYRVKSDWDDRGPNNSVLALEVIGLDPAAERAIWQWLSGIDLVGPHQGLARAGAAPAPARADRAAAARADGPRGALAAPARHAGRARGADLPRPGAITFELTDAFRPANAGRWRLEVGRTVPRPATGEWRGLGHRVRRRART